MVAGSVNLTPALLAGATLPALPNLAGAMVVGFFSYGVSLALAMGEAVTLPLLVARSLMALGVWLHLTEHHEHEHVHEAMEYEHEHVHDEHHRHEPPYLVAPGTKHSHRHRHRHQ